MIILFENAIGIRANETLTIHYKPSTQDLHKMFISLTSKYIYVADILQQHRVQELPGIGEWIVTRSVDRLFKKSVT